MYKDSTVIVPVPSLIATLVDKEKRKGAALTEEEVLFIRDNCTCIAMTVEQERHLEASRGYVDLDPERVWEQWQKTRHQFDD